MSHGVETPDGTTPDSQRTEQQRNHPYRIDEKQFENWEMRWNSKQEVIDHFLQELELAMAQGQATKVPTLRLVCDDDED